MENHNNDARTDGNAQQNEARPAADSANQREYSDSVNAPDPERKERKNAQAAEEDAIPDHAKATPEERMEQQDSALAEAEEFFVSRDDEGRVRPVETFASGFGMVKVRPLTYGQAETYFGDGEVAQAEAGTVAKVLRKHVAEPNLEAACKEKFGKVTHGQTSYLNEHIIRDEMKSFGPQALLSAIIRESGMSGAQVSVNDDGQAQIDFGGSGNL